MRDILLGGIEKCYILLFSVFFIVGFLQSGIVSYGLYIYYWLGYFQSYVREGALERERRF